MLCSEIAKRFGQLSSEVGYGLCTLVSNNFHHVKVTFERTFCYNNYCHRRTGGGGDVTFSLAKFTYMQCPNVRLLNWVANALNLHEKQKCSQFPNLMKLL